MSEAETLRLVAEVVDKSTGPMRQAMCKEAAVMRRSCPVNHPPSFPADRRVLRSARPPHLADHVRS
jgi:hypothetical protein